MAMRRPVLEFDDVTKVYTTGELSVAALQNISLTVAEREVIVVMGPSGAGKTTFLTIAGALMRPTSGRVVISGTDITALDERRLPKVRQEKIGFIFQSFNLLEALSALQNVELVMETRGVTGRGAKARGRELLSMVGIDQQRGSLPKQLSGGQKQRVAIARALAGRPPLVLADEPTASLDAHSGKEVVELLTAMARERGQTVVVVTHDNRIFSLADRILAIEDGRLASKELAA
jgi:putative ABC transport system ATP-binding protein